MINPTLLYMPESSERIELVFIDAAICTQNLKHAMKWLRFRNEIDTFMHGQCSVDILR